MDRRNVAREPLSSLYFQDERNGKNPFYPKRINVQPFSPTTVALHPDGESDGTRVVFTLPRDACDLIGSVSLQVDLPAVSGGQGYVHAPGLSAIRRAKLKIGGVVVEDIERQFIYLKLKAVSTPDQWTCLMESMGGEAGSTKARCCVVPLEFMARKNTRPRQSFLPMCAFEEPVVVECEIEAPDKLLLSGGGELAGGVSFRLLVEMIAFSERRHAFDFIDTRSALYFDSVLDMEHLSFRYTDEGDVTHLREIKVPLNEINQPVKYFIVVAYDHDAPRTPSKYFEYLDPVWFENVDVLVDGRSALCQSSDTPPKLFTHYTSFRAGDELSCLAFNKSILITHAIHPNSNSFSGFVDYSIFQEACLQIKLKPVLGAQRQAKIEKTPFLVKVYAVCANKLTFDPLAPPGLFYAR